MEGPTYEEMLKELNKSNDNGRETWSPPVEI